MFAGLRGAPPPGMQQATEYFYQLLEAEDRRHGRLTNERVVRVPGPPAYYPDGGKYGRLRDGAVPSGGTDG